MDDLHDLIEEARKDPFIGFQNDFKGQKIAIRANGQAVGFMMPERLTLKGQMYWRTGAIYIHSAWRGKGYASQAVIQFFKDRPWGIAYIEPTNLPSLAVYRKAGFIVDGLVTGVKTRRTFHRLLRHPSTPALPLYQQW